MTKRRITRALAALLAALTLLSLAACGDVTVVDVDEESSTTVQQTEEQQKNNTVKTDNKQTDAKSDNTKKDDAKKNDVKKDDTSKTADTKKDDVKEEDKKAEDEKALEEQKKAEEEAKKAQEDAKKAEEQKKQEEEKKQENTPASNTENTANNSSKSNTCTISISCSTILNNMDICRESKKSYVPSSGTILSTTTVTFTEGESVYDVLQRVCRDNGIQMESTWTATYNSAYVEGINNLYEFDVGDASGWMYKVNGWFPNYGCSSYELKNGDNICWVYTCDLGDDVGGGYMG